MLTTPLSEREARVEGVRKVRPSWEVRDELEAGVSLERSKVWVASRVEVE